MTQRIIPAVAALLLGAAATVMAPIAHAAATAATTATAATAATTATGAPTATTHLTMDDTTVPGLTAELIRYPDSVIEPGGAVRAMVRVTNGTGRVLEDAAVELAVTTSRLTSPAQFAGPFMTTPVASVSLGTPVQVTDTRDTAATDPDEEATHTVHRMAAGASSVVTVTAPSEDLPFPATSWGVYGLTVEVTTTEGSGSSAGATGPEGSVPVTSGVITWAGTPVPELEVAALVRAVGASARMSAVTANAGLNQVTLASDGTQLAATHAPGLALSNRAVLRMPAYSPDLTSLAHAGETTLLDYALERSGSATSPAVPWVAPVAQVDQSTLSLAAAQGATAVLGARQPGPAAPAALRATWGDREMTVMVPDPDLSATIVLDDAAGREAPAQAVATAALLAGAATGPVLIDPGVTWLHGEADASALAELLAAPFVRPISVTDLASRDDLPSVPVTATVSGADEDMPASQVQALAARLSAGKELAATAEEPATILDPLGSALLEPLATALRFQPEVRDTRATTALEQADQTLGSVRVTAGSDVNLIAAKGSVPVNVRNDLPVDVTVVVDVTSFSPNLRIQNAPTITVPAESTKTALVEVEAVSSANVEAEAVLRNSESVPLSEPVALSIRVRADWGNAITGVFTVGLVLLLIAGTWRTIRRGRKDTRTGPAGEQVAPEQSAAEQAPPTSEQDADA